MGDSCQGQRTFVIQIPFRSPFCRYIFLTAIWHDIHTLFVVQMLPAAFPSQLSALPHMYEHVTTLGMSRTTSGFSHQHHQGASTLHSWLRAAS